MISRRLVRIKALQALYSFQQGDSIAQFQWPNLTPKEKDYFNETLSNLIESIQQSHDFCLFLLDFPFQLSQYLLEEQTLEKTKFYPDQQKSDPSAFWIECPSSNTCTAQYQILNANPSPSTGLI